MSLSTDLFGLNRSVLAKDPCHSRTWLWTSPGMVVTTDRYQRTLYRMWCWKTIATWSLWVNVFSCVMPHCFLSLAAKTYKPLVNLYDVCSSYGSDVFAWAQKVCCSHLPKKGSNGHLYHVTPEPAPSSSFRGSDVQEACQKSYPCLTHRVLHCPDQRWSSSWSKEKSCGH